MMTVHQLGEMTPLQRKNKQTQLDKEQALMDAFSQISGDGKRWYLKWFEEDDDINRIVDDVVLCFKLVTRNEAKFLLQYALQKDLEQILQNKRLAP